MWRVSLSGRWHRVTGCARAVAQPPERAVPVIAVRRSVAAYSTDWPWQNRSIGLADVTRRGGVITDSSPIPRHQRRTHPMNRPLTAPASDIALVIARVIFAVVMFAHGYQKVFINGLGRTTEGFERMAIPLAIVSASFVAVMEVVGAVLLLCGALTTV